MTAELIFLLLATVPILICAVRGWRDGSERQVRGLAIFSAALLVAVILHRWLASYLSRTLDMGDPALIGAVSFLGVFVVVLTIGLVVTRREDEETPWHWSHRLSGLLAGAILGAVIGLVLLAIGSFVLPSVVKIDPAEIPLVGDKPKAVAALLERTISLKPAPVAAAPAPAKSSSPSTPPAPAVASAPAAPSAPVVSSPPAAPAPPAVAPAPVAAATPPATPAPRQKYRRFSYESAIQQAHRDVSGQLSLSSAFSLSQLEQAKAKAQREGKLLGFLMVWDSFFTRRDTPMDTGGRSALLHFYQVFNGNMVLVFVRHESELDQAPDAVKKGFFGPDEGGWAPNMAVVSADAQQYICEIPLGGGGQSDGNAREPVFRDKIKVIDAWLAAQPEAR